jgi:tetratricopeptide (TPR) repeat protein
MMNVRTFSVKMRISVLFIFLLSVSYAFAQRQACPESQNKKSQKYYKDAEAAFKSKKDYEKALDLAQSSIDADPENSWAYLLASQIAQKKKDYKTMEEMLSKSLELCEYVDADAYFQLGWLQYDLKKYK